MSHKEIQECTVDSSDLTLKEEHDDNLWTGDDTMKMRIAMASNTIEQNLASEIHSTNFVDDDCKPEVIIPDDETDNASSSLVQGDFLSSQPLPSTSTSTLSQSLPSTSDSTLSTEMSATIIVDNVDVPSQIDSMLAGEPSPAVTELVNNEEEVEAENLRSASSLLVSMGLVDYGKVKFPIDPTEFPSASAPEVVVNSERGIERVPPAGYSLQPSLFGPLEDNTRNISQHRLQHVKNPFNEEHVAESPQPIVDHSDKTGLPYVEYVSESPLPTVEHLGGTGVPHGETYTILDVYNGEGFIAEPYLGVETEIAPSLPAVPLDTDSYLQNLMNDDAQNTRSHDSQFRGGPAYTVTTEIPSIASSVSQPLQSSGNSSKGPKRRISPRTLRLPSSLDSLRKNELSHHSESEDSTKWEPHNLIDFYTTNLSSASTSTALATKRKSRRMFSSESEEEGAQEETAVKKKRCVSRKQRDKKKSSTKAAGLKSKDHVKAKKKTKKKSSLKRMDKPKKRTKATTKIDQQNKSTEAEVVKSRPRGRPLIDRQKYYDEFPNINRELYDTLTKNQFHCRIARLRMVARLATDPIAKRLHLDAEAKRARANREKRKSKRAASHPSQARAVSNFKKARQSKPIKTVMMAKQSYVRQKTQSRCLVNDVSVLEDRYDECKTALKVAKNRIKDLEKSQRDLQESQERLVQMTRSFRKRIMADVGPLARLTDIEKLTTQLEFVRRVRETDIQMMYLSPILDRPADFVEGDGDRCDISSSELPEEEVENDELFSILLAQGPTALNQIAVNSDHEMPTKYMGRSGTESDIDDYEQEYIDDDGFDTTNDGSEMVLINDVRSFGYNAGGRTSTTLPSSRALTGQQQKTARLLELCTRRIKKESVAKVEQLEKKFKIPDCPALANRANNVATTST